MRKTPMIISMFLCVAMLFTLVGCSLTPKTSTTPSSEKTIRIAAIMKNRSNPYYQSMDLGFKKAETDFKVVVDVFALESDADIDKEMVLANDLLSKNYDGMVLIPINGTAFAPFVKKANDAKLPIVNIDTQLDAAALKELGATYITYVGSDDYSAGQLAAEAIAKAINNKGQVAVIEGSPGSSTADMRKLGLNDYMKKINDKGGSIEIVASQTANWDTNKAYEVAQNILQAKPKLNAIFAANDLMAIGAINAAQAANRPEISIVSIDKIPDAVTAVKNGKLLATISQAPDQMAYIGVQKLLDSIAGKSVEKEYRTENKLYYKADL